MTFAADLTASARLYPLSFDPKPNMVLFVALGEADYEAASFLDLRMIAPGTAGEWKSWAEVRDAASGLPARCHFIFHISHVGSTLLSRLVGMHPKLFSLREPVVMRRLAEAHLALDEAQAIWTRPELDERLGVFLRLWSRTFQPGQTAVIKATSFVSEMASHLMECLPEARSIFMYVPPRTFLPALLGGAISDITGNAEKRLVRLHRRLGTVRWRQDEMSPGEMAAMSWLSEMASLDDAARQFPERTLWLDFDQFLDEPEEYIQTTLAHLDASEPAGWARTIAASPAVRQYAKAPQFAFDARERSQRLAIAGQAHADEIRKGLDWLERAATEFPGAHEILHAAR